MNVIYGDNDIQMRDYVSMLVEATLDCDILEASSENEIFTILGFEDDICFLMFDYSIVSDDGVKIRDFLVDHKNLCTVVLSGTDESTNPIVQEILSFNEHNSYIRKPFKDTEFFPVIEGIAKSYESAHTKDESSEDHVQATGKKASGSDITEKSESSDWNYGAHHKKASDHTVENADWDIHGKKKKADVAQEADWDIHGKKKKAGAAEEADWDIHDKKKNAGAAQEADWELGAKGEGREQEGDWELGAKGKGSEQEANWELGAKGEGHEQEADWDLGSKGESKEEEADWTVGGKTQGQWRAAYEERKEKVEEDYDHDRFKRVKIKRLLNFNDVCCDVFIKIGKEKYLKLINKSESYQHGKLNSYIEKKVLYLYIEKEFYEEFTHQFNDLVFSKLSMSQNMSTDVKVLAELSAYDAVLASAKSFGVTERVAGQVEESIKSVVKTIDKLPGLDDLLKKIMRGGNFISEHSLLLSYVAGQIAGATSWGSEATLSKLSMAALFHDATLDSEVLAKVNDLGEAKKSGFSSDDITIIKEHPAKAAELINAGESIFPDVDTIIAQHHEKPDQSGFPRGLGALSISPLSCIFIIAHDFVDYLLKNSQYSDMSREELKEFFKEKYHRGNFKKPLEAFLKVF